MADEHPCVVLFDPEPKTVMVVGPFEDLDAGCEYLADLAIQELGSLERFEDLIERTIVASMVPAQESEGISLHMHKRTVTHGDHSHHVLVPVEVAA